jgi:hypothetical protein
MRSRDKNRTQQALQYAILRIKNKKEKMSISAVAREAEVHASLIHNTYPDIAEEIRAQMGRSTRAQRDQKAEDLIKARATIRELKQKNEALESDLAKLASLNLTLEHEIVVLKATVRGDVAVFRAAN